MIAPAAKPAARPDPVEVFTARCEARAYLWGAVELDLHEAVDVLQSDAERDGLMARLGQDEIQRIMAKAFAAVRGHAAISIVPETEPGTSRADRLARLKLERRAPKSTVAALMHSLRQRGIAALVERNTRNRLAELSRAQIREALARLIALRPRYPAIDDDLLLKLGRQR